MLSNSEIDDVVYLIVNHGKYKCTLDELKEIIKQHSQYDTLETIRMGRELVAYTRYNIVGNTVIVIDSVVKKDYRNKHLLKLMLSNGLIKFPTTRYMKYQRCWKRRSHDRTFKISRFLNEKGEVCNIGNGLEEITPTLAQ